MRSRGWGLFLLVLGAAGAGPDEARLDWLAWNVRMDAAAGGPASEAVVLYGEVLEEGDAFLRRRAVAALGDLAEDAAAADLIREALFDEDPRVVAAAQAEARSLADGEDWIAEAAEVIPRKGAGGSGSGWHGAGRAVEALACSGLDDAAERVSASWDHPSAFVRHKVAISLAVLGDAGVAALARGFAQGSARVRRLCARELARRREAVPAALPGVDRALREGDRALLAPALVIATRIGPGAASVVPLAARLVPGDLASEAMEFLSAAGPAGARALLAHVRETDGALRLQVLSRLAGSGSDLPEVLAAFREFAGSEEAPLAALARQGIAAFPTRDDEGVEELLVTVRGGKAAPAQAGRVLSRKASIATVARLIGDEDARVRSAALYAVAELPPDLPGARALLGPALTAALGREAAAAAGFLARVAPEESVDPLIELATHGDQKARAYGCRALATLGEPVLQRALAAFLRNGSEDGWATAVLMGLRALASRIEAESRDFPVEARARLMGVFRQAGARGELEKCARDTRTEVRLAALLALRDKRFPDTLSLWIEATGDASPLVRRVAVEGLRAQGGEAHVAVLEPLLDDPDKVVRYGARAALVRLGPSGCAAVCARWDSGTGDAQGRVDLLQSLADCGEPGFQRIVAALADKVQDVRVMAARILAGKRTGGEALVRALADPEEAVRFEAALALVANGDGELALAAMVELLHHEKPHPAGRARLVLGAIGAAAVPEVVRAGMGGWTGAEAQFLRDLDFEAVPPLIELLSSGDTAVRFRAASGLALLGPSSQLAVEPLAALLGDHERSVAVAAIEALSSMGRAASPALPALRAIADDRHLGAAARAAMARIER